MVVSASDTQLVVNVSTGVISGIAKVQVGNLTATGNFSTSSVTTLAGGTQGLMNGVGSDAQFMAPAGIAVDNSGNVYVADFGANNIRKITPDGTVSNFEGDPNDSRGFTTDKG